MAVSIYFLIMSIPFFKCPTRLSKDLFLIRDSCCDQDLPTGGRWHRLESPPVARTAIALTESAVRKHLIRTSLPQLSLCRYRITQLEVTKLYGCCPWAVLHMDSGRPAFPFSENALYADLGVVFDFCFMTFNFHDIHGVTPWFSNHFQMLNTAPLSVSDVGCGLWNTLTSLNKTTATPEASRSLTSAPRATNNETISSHSKYTPLTLALSPQRVERGTVFIGGGRQEPVATLYRENKALSLLLSAPNRVERGPFWRFKVAESPFMAVRGPSILDAPARSLIFLSFPTK